MPDVVALFGQAPLSKTIVFVGLLFGHLLSMPSVKAVNFGVEVGDSLTYVDNATQSSRESNSNLENRFYVQLTGSESTSDYQAVLDYRAENVTHTEESFRDQSVLQGSASLLLELIPQRLNWEFSHNRSEVLSDSSAPDIPSNRVERQTFETGPSLSFRLTERNAANLSFRKSEVKFEESSGSDSGREQTQLSFSHIVSPLTSVSINGVVTEVEFDESDLQYHLKNIFVGYSRKLRNGRFSLNVGYNRVESDAGPLSSSIESESTFYDVALTGTINYNHVLSVKTNRNITDSSVIGLNLGPDFAADSLDATVLSFLQNIRRTDVVSVLRHDLKYLYGNNQSRWGVGMSLFQVENDYESSTPSQRRLGYSVNVPYQIRENSSLSANFNSTRTKVAGEAGDNKDSLVSLTYSVRASQHLSWRGWYSKRFRRDVGASGKSRSNSMGVGFSYHF